MGIMKFLGLSTKHDGQHAAKGQRGKHSGKQVVAKNPKKSVKKSKGK